MMNIRTRTGIEVLWTALFIGAAGNLLLRQTPWGLNAFLFVTVFTLVMVGLTYRHRAELLTARTLSLHGAMIFFASMFLIRDSEQLLVFDTLAIIALMGVLVLPNFGIDQRIAGAFHYAGGVVWAGLSSLFGGFAVLGADVDWTKIEHDRVSRHLFSALRGLAIALPVVMIFGALLMAADAAFEGMINRIVYFEIDTVVSHVMLTAFLAWLTAGYFRSTLIEHAMNNVATQASPVPNADTDVKADAKTSTDGSLVDKFTAEPGDSAKNLPDNVTIIDHINISDPPNTGAEDPTPKVEAAGEPRKRDWQNWDNSSIPSFFTLGRVETIIILGAVNVLFLAFVVLQLPYLFGGMELVQNTPDFKLADYARRGFGELVFLSVLVLPMLLGGHWLLRRDEGRNETIFRVFAGIQVGLLFVIMASAMQRLILLTGELGYGWTTVRFYPMVVIIWLAIVFVWFTWTVLRGRRNNFAWGALWSAIVVLAATNLMNPDDFIARKNIQLMQHGRDYDAVYVSNLSDDANPAVMEGIGSMSDEDQCSTRKILYRRLIEARGEGDVRSWSWPRHEAYALLEQNAGALLNGRDCPDTETGIKFQVY